MLIFYLPLTKTTILDKFSNIDIITHSEIILQIVSKHFDKAIMKKNCCITNDIFFFDYQYYYVL